MIICAGAMVYWINNLEFFDDAGTENQDTTAHFFKIKIKSIGNYFKSFPISF
jgi:hypothetical protein